MAFFVLRALLPQAFHSEGLSHSAVMLTDIRLARLSQWSLAIILGLIGFKMAAVAWRWLWDIRLSTIAVAAALPLLLLSPHRLTLLRRIDWTTLLFFVSMFVLMASVWHTGILQNWTTRLRLDLQSIPSVLGFSVLLSQLISNVPLAALSVPLIGEGDGTLGALMALAAGSTIAGNLFILGAASNVIIIQRAEQEGCSLTFGEFARIGIPLTVLQTMVYGFYLRWALG